MIAENRMPQIADYATPPAICQAINALLGGVDLDPATSVEFNAFGVQAKRIHTIDDNGLDQKWEGKVYLNPPGGKTRPRASAWWDKLVQHYKAGDVPAAVYMNFALDSFQWSQAKERIPILTFPTAVFAERIAFYRHEQIVEYDKKKYSVPTSPIIEAKSPNRPCAITWLPPVGADIDLNFKMFCSVLGDLGFKCYPVRSML